MAALLIMIDFRLRAVVVMIRAVARQPHGIELCPCRREAIDSRRMFFGTVKTPRTTRCPIERGSGLVAQGAHLDVGPLYLSKGCCARLVLAVAAIKMIVECNPVASVCSHDGSIATWRIKDVNPLPASPISIM